MIRSWSFSKLLEYERCPHSVTLKQPKGEALSSREEAKQRGIEVHSSIEGFLRGEHDNALFPELLAIRETQPAIEEEWGFDENWKPTEWKKAWLRVKLDAARPGWTADWKTGKRYPIKHVQQAQLYAIANAIHYDFKDPVMVEFFYTDETPIGIQAYPIQHADILRERWHQRASVMCSDANPKPKPSKSNCGKCFVSSVCDYKHEV